jgi:DNA adenine methylase
LNDILNYERTQINKVITDNIKIADHMFDAYISEFGGKRGLLTQLLEKFPRKFENYHEPFLGGGAVFFELYSQGLLKNKKIFLSDINSELINTYNVVKNNPNELINNLENFKEQHNIEFYYETREIDLKEEFEKLTNIQRATRFIYLNKTCFNGLYRVNKK